MAPTPPPLAKARSVSSKIRFFSSAVKMRRCALAGTSTSAELATKGTAILASLTMFLLAALLCNYGRGRCLIDIGTEGIPAKREFVGSKLFHATTAHNEHYDIRRLAADLSAEAS